MRYTVVLYCEEIVGGRNIPLNIAEFDDYSIAYWFMKNYVKTQPTGAEVLIVSNEFGNVLISMKAE